MQGKLAFGRRRHEQLPSKLKKPAKREEVEKSCRAGACAYAAVVEATRFRAEATRKGKAKQKGAGAWATSDCDSSLYDSFELDSFSSHLGYCLAEERRPAHVAPRKSDLASSWRLRPNAPPRWHSRRLSISCCPFTFPSCFPKRTPTIQLGKRKKPSLHSALHVIAKVARRGCHVIAALPACPVTRANVRQPQKLQQTHHHYHHHLHHYTLERPSEGRECDNCDRNNDHEEHDRMSYEERDNARFGDRNDNIEHERSLGKVAPELLPSHLPTHFLSPHSLAYLPLQEIDPHLTSIKYHS